MTEYLHAPVEPFVVAPGDDASRLLAKLAATSFQARNLGQAVKIWKQMLEDETTIFFGLAGAMVPAGMRKVMVYLIQNRLIDVLVSTGANLFHDLHESLGYAHYQGSPHADDVELARHNISRIYDVVAPEAEFDDTEAFVTRFANSLDQDHAYTTREFFYLLGQHLAPQAREEGILTAAARAGVPIYCPAFGDSAYGMGVAAGRTKGGNRLLFDIVQDVVETTQIACEAKATGVIYVGGGTPKNFIQQTQIADYIFDKYLPGHQYAIQITTDAPHWGGLSGCTFEEAQSWIKVAPQAKMATVYSDATIALPLLVSALAEEGLELAKRRAKPAFALQGGFRIAAPDVE